jgi:formylglycine-generating enzyme required for sulfatase activity
MPVTGIDAEEIQAYLAWLRDSGTLPGARLCREDEWERGARGADFRSFPHGETLGESEANFDRTYGRQPNAFGADAAGSHPASQSPFGLHDMAGNVWEITRSVQKEGELVAKGGAFYFSAASASIANREVIEPTLADVTMGFRVCADAP